MFLALYERLNSKPKFTVFGSLTFGTLLALASVVITRPTELPVRVILIICSYVVGLIWSRLMWALVVKDSVAIVEAKRAKSTSKTV